MKPKMARAIFYSARSFNGRSEMFEAAMANSSLNEDAKAALEAVIAKAAAYSSFRNSLAHGQVVGVFSRHEDGRPEIPC